MEALDTTRLVQDYERDGFVTSMKVLSDEEIAPHKADLERAEAQLGSLHYIWKIHTFLRSPYELATHPRLLDLVEAILGPNVLLYNVGYIIKEPNTPGYTSWHQDLTYWGFDSDDIVSAWLALSPATSESGCMQMIPGSHKQGMREQELTDDSDNMLYRGQTIKEVSEDKAVLCPLGPGEVSLHHGWTMHSSTPNKSSDRRIGLNIQYIKPSMRQQNLESDSALLIRGKDCYGHYDPDTPASDQIPADAAERFSKLTEKYFQRTNVQAINDLSGQGR